MNNANYAAGNTPGKLAGVAGNPAPATGVAAPAPAPAPGAAPAGAPVQALPFGHWIAAGGALPADALSDPAAAAPQDPAAPVSGAEAGEAAEALEETLVPDVLLAAMAPTVAPAALPAMMLAMPGAKPGLVSDAATTPVDDATGVSGAGAVAQGSAARAVPPAADVLVATTQPVVQAAIVPTAAARPDLGAAQAVAAQANAAPAAEHAAPDTIADFVTVTSGTGVNAATGQNVSGADSIVLAGPPTAWRQNLQEALGERLQIQLGRNIEQATIRLEPPMLGRIDIAIRHSGGNLEIHIAASNADVLRQLNTVSDSLRNDLAGRQYGSVSVNVTEVPRMQASAQTGSHTPGQGNTDAQGRPRQEQEQARTPGRALGDDAVAGASLFSMN